MAKNAHWSDDFEGIERAVLKATDQAYRSQETILEHLFGYYRPKTVVDIGCGPGYWLYFCRALGVEDVHGYDAIELPDDERELPAAFYTVADLSQPMHFEQKADLAISTEVAEHIDIARVGTFIDNLTRASDVVLFSAAIPYQGGIGHVNENWAEYWFELFSKRKFRCFDIFRLPFWNDPRIHYYYRQNLLLFVHEDRAEDFVAQGLREESCPYSLIHPDLYIQTVNRARPPEERRMEDDARIYYHGIGMAEGSRSPLEQRYTYGQETVWFDDENSLSSRKRLETERALLQERVHELTHERDHMLTSTSWRVTAPLRALKLLYWKLTGS